MEDIKRHDSKTKRIKQFLSTFFHETFQIPLYLIVHPIRGWDEFKHEKIAKNWVSIFYLAMMLLAVIIHTTAKGFIVGGTDIKHFSLLKTILTILLPVFIGTIANWCVGSLFDGKGKMPEIFRVINYSFFPYVWLSILATIVSNFIGADETMYYTVLMSVGTGLTIWMMFFGIMGIHENSFGMNIVNIVFTILVIAIIIFAILLFFSFVERILGWLYAIYSEIRMRYF